jgi:hypothetical protein
MFNICGSNLRQYEHTQLILVIDKVKKFELYLSVLTEFLSILSPPRTIFLPRINIKVTYNGLSADYSCLMFTVPIFRQYLEYLR